MLGFDKAFTRVLPLSNFYENKTDKENKESNKRLSSEQPNGEEINQNPQQLIWIAEICD